MLLFGRVYEKSGFAWQTSQQWKLLPLTSYTPRAFIFIKRALTQSKPNELRAFASDNGNNLKASLEIKFQFPLNSNQPQSKQNAIERRHT